MHKSLRCDDVMRTVAVIAEFNPFHNGHACLLDRIREELSPDALIVLMSGSFVQRGEPALIDKHRRTRTALHAGADLVLSLPVVYSVAPAEIFARGAVLTLNATGIADLLAFGSEAGALTPLTKLATVLSDTDSAFEHSLLNEMCHGATYPSAMERALADNHPDMAGLANLLNAPNNVLGVEYLRSLKITDSRILPVTLARREDAATITGAAALRSMALRAYRRPAEGDCGRDRKEMDDAFPGFSAPGSHDQDSDTSGSSLVENRIRDEGDPGETGLPDLLAPFLTDASLREIREILCSPDERLVSPEDLTPMLKYRLITTDRDALAGISDISGDIARRIMHYRLCADGFSSFAQCIKVKAFTLSRIRRCLTQLLLDIRRRERDAMLKNGCTALRVLGFKETARPLLGMLGSRHDPRIPLIIRGADYNQETDPLTRRLIDLDLVADALYDQLALTGTRKSEAEKQPVIL